MDFGENALVIKQLIYQYAKKEFVNADAPISLQAFIMESVAMEFQKEAYKEKIFKPFQRPPEKEEKTGKPEQLINVLKKEIGKNAGKEDTVKDGGKKE